MGLFELTPSQLCNKLEQLCRSCDEIGINFATTKAHYEGMSRQYQSYLSTLSLKFEKSMTERRARALATSEWKDFLKLYDACELTYFLAQSEYESVKQKIEALRTIISTKKTELSNIKTGV